MVVLAPKICGEATVQRSAKVGAPGLGNFITAVAKVSNFCRLLYCSKSYCTGKMLLYLSNASKSLNIAIST